MGVTLTAIIDGAIQEIDEIGCDFDTLSQEESLEFYVAIRDHCRSWIENIESDLGLN